MREVNLLAEISDLRLNAQLLFLGHSTFTVFREGVPCI